jgi:hypothetical protein
MDFQFISSVELSDGGIGLAAGNASNPQLRRSTDYGASWSQAVHPSQATPLRNFDWIEGTSEVWAVTSQTGLFQSTDEGIGWERHTLAPPNEFVAMDVDFIDDTGWCVGYRSTLGPSRIFRWVTTTGVTPIPAGAARLKVVAYPNPFRSEVVIALHDGGMAPAECSVYDVTGHQIWGEETSPGAHGHRWDGRDRLGRSVPRGTYFYRVRSGTTEIVGRVVKSR